MRARRSLVVGLAVLAAAAAAGVGAVGAHAAAPRSEVVISGMARFEVLSPTLIRIEYAPDGVFEDRPTENVLDRDQMMATGTPFTETDNGVTLTITTSAMTMTYIERSPLTTGVTFTLAGSTTPVVPTWNPCQQAPQACTPPIGGLPNPPTSSDIGGYQRELVSINPVQSADGEISSVPVQPVNSSGDDVFNPLTEGMLNTNGSYLLDDTSTALRTEAPGALPAVTARPTDPGYMDGYFFGYGSDYAQGLKDLSDLTGPAPILPEWAFGPWFSDYQSYTAADYEDTIFPKLAATDTPIDGFVLDTNWKDPADSWNSYQFSDASHPNSAFPDPAAFLAWAKSYGLHTVLNIHPSIDEDSTQYPQTEATAGSLSSPEGGCQFYRTSPACDVFDWSVPSQAKAFFALQTALLQTNGISSLWLDWCCDASNTNTVAGVTPDTLVADQYGQVMTSLGNRSFVLARIGSGIYSAAAGQVPNSYTGDAIAPATGPWGAHRSTIAFTGDATSDFQTLAYEAVFEPGESSAIGLPYLSNDIGGYTGGHLADDLYVRWVQLGTFSSILRLHGKNSDRLPYEYADGSGADTSGERFLRLREALVPYLYTAAAQAHDTGLPLTREMAVAYPGNSAALAATNQWMLGDNVLVAPITTAGATASRTVWLPPGQWTDFFTGETVSGGTAGATITTPAEGFDRMPVYVKAGGIVTLAPPMMHVGQTAEDPLTIRVASGAAGTSSMYEDAGDGNGYLSGQRSSTPMAYTEPAAGTAAAGAYTFGPDAGQLVISPRSGTFPGASTSRAYAVQFLSTARPTNVTVDGSLVPETSDTTDHDQTDTVSAVPTSDSWAYDPTTDIITVLVAPRSTSDTVVVDHDVVAGSGVSSALPEVADPALLLAPAVGVFGLALLVRRRRRSRGTTAA